MESLLSVDQVVTNFKKEELDAIFAEQRKISQIFNSFEERRDYLLQHLDEYDPKAIHYTHQHLAVIQANLREQLCEMRTLIARLEEHRMVELEENQSYLKLEEEREDLHHVFRVFVPYILICAIYLRKRRERERVS